MRDERLASMFQHPAGKGIPESVEVAQERMDREACAITRPAPRDLLRRDLAVVVAPVRAWDGWAEARWLAKVIVAVLAVWLVVMILGLTITAGYIGQATGGWPA